MNAIDFDDALRMLLELNGEQHVTVIVGAPGSDPRMIAEFSGPVIAAEGLGRRAEEDAFIVALGRGEDAPKVFLHRRGFKYAQRLKGCLRLNTEAADIQFWITAET